MASDLGFTDPTSAGNQPKIALAPRPVNLAGKVVGLLDNTKEQADIILRTVGEALCVHHGAARVVVRRKEAFSKPVTKEMIDDMANEVQIAVAALGG